MCMFCAAIPMSASIGAAVIGKQKEKRLEAVCGAIIQPQQAYSSVKYKDQRYYFCCPVCQGAFKSDLQTYLTLIEHARS